MREKKFTLKFFESLGEIGLCPSFPLTNEHWWGKDRKERKTVVYNDQPI